MAAQPPHHLLHLKRSANEADLSSINSDVSDDDDDNSLFDGSSGDVTVSASNSTLKCGNSGGQRSERSSDRKRRRGVIEKRRRDRINNSLCELRRLVPQAFEKQGNAKLEKAEILQLTVDYLRDLHHRQQKGAMFADPEALAVDYRTLGFRECMAEVARYLSLAEGFDSQDPMRLRLLTHLQCFSTNCQPSTTPPLPPQQMAPRPMPLAQPQAQQWPGTDVAQQAQHFTASPGGSYNHPATPDQSPASYSSTNANNAATYHPTTSSPYNFYHNNTNQAYYQRATSQNQVDSKWSQLVGLAAVASAYDSAAPLSAASDNQLPQNHFANAKLGAALSSSAASVENWQQQIAGPSQLVKPEHLLF